MLRVSHRLYGVILHTGRPCLRLSHTKSSPANAYDNIQSGLFKNIEKFSSFNVASDGSLLQKENDKWSIDNEDWDDELDLNLNFSLGLNREPNKHYIKNAEATTMTKNEAFFTSILKKKFPRKYYYLNKLKRNYIDLSIFDLKEPELKEKIIKLKTNFISTDDFNDYLNEIISYKYPNDSAIDENIHHIIKHISLFQAVVNVDSFNLLIRYLGRRNKWERTFKLLNLMKTINIIPNKETALWLIRNCCYHQDKNKRLQRLRSILQLGIIEWKIQASSEIKLMLWLALPYSQYWLHLNSILVNEGLKALIRHPLAKTHYTKNMITHYYHVKKLNPTSSFFHIKAQTEKHKIQNRIEKDLIVDELLKCLLRQADIKRALQLLKSKSIQKVELSFGQHGSHIIQWHLDNAKLPLVHAVVVMNELMKFLPNSKEIKPQLLLPILNYLRKVGMDNGSKAEEVIALLESDIDSQIWNLKWKKDKPWNFENNLDPVHLKLIEKLYQLGR